METLLQQQQPTLGLTQTTPPMATTGLALSVSVVIPAYNEADRLPETLTRLGEFLNRWIEAAGLESAQPFELIVVDDGSQDDTAAGVDRFIREWQQRYPALVLRRISHAVNQGKGAAMTTGILAAQRDWVLLYDADSATPIEALEQFWSRIQVAPQQAQNTFFIGSRVHPKAHTQTRWERQMIGRSFHRLVSLLFPWGKQLHDTQCGFKLLPLAPATRIARRTRIKGYCWDVELLHLAQQDGVAVQELPVRWTHQPGSKVSLWRDPWGMLWQLLRIRFLVTRPAKHRP